MIGNFIQAIATYDKTNKKVYATINGLWLFSIGDSVLAIMDGSTILARVEEFETLGDTGTIIFLDIDNDFWVGSQLSLLNSGSENPVLLKGLSNSKELERPFATIDVPVMLNAAVLSALKERIALETLTFAGASNLVGFNSSSKVNLNFHAGNPNTVIETFFADKVKANISTKGLQFLSERTRTRGQVFISDQPVKQELLSNYLRDMHVALREQNPFISLYTVTVVDEKLNVVLNKKPIKKVLTFKSNGEIGYRLKFEDALFIPISGTYTIIIEKETVKNADYLDWTGSSGMSAPSIFLQGLNKEIPLEVKYVKKSINGLAFLELDRSPEWVFLNNKLAAVTFDKKTIYGALNLTEDNKVQFTKPVNVSELVWAKDLAAFTPSGKGILTLLEVGSPAKGETLQLKVDLGNVGDARNYYMLLQDTPLTVSRLLPRLATLKVINAEISPEKAGVNVLTGIANLATGTVKWFTDYFEIDVSDNSRKTFNVVNSNGAVEGFRKVKSNRFLDAAVADIKAKSEKELQNIINPTPPVFAGAEIEWLFGVQVKGERFEVVFRDADVVQTTSRTTYKFYYDQGIPELLLANVTDGQIFLNVTRTESQRAL